MQIFGGNQLGTYLVIDRRKGQKREAAKLIVLTSVYINKNLLVTIILIMLMMIIILKVLKFVAKVQLSSNFF